MNYDFLVSTYRTERLKVLSVWSMFRDEDMDVRPHPIDTRGRSVREQMVHQCLSEDLWFRTFFGIDVESPVLPSEETRLAFIQKYAGDSEKRGIGESPGDRTSVRLVVYFNCSFLARVLSTRFFS